MLIDRMVSDPAFGIQVKVHDALSTEMEVSPWVCMIDQMIAPGLPRGECM
jgi:hypothetical protein